MGVGSIRHGTWTTISDESARTGPSSVSYLVLSGLPASGKSTLARMLSPALQLPVIDKDDILEGLFLARGVGDGAWRSALSREADGLMETMAMSQTQAILVSWWRHPESRVDSGTATAWLRGLPTEPLEIHCVCEPIVAARRFLARVRHEGHLDTTRTLGELVQQFEAHAAHGPLGIGACITVSTMGDPDTAALIPRIRSRSNSPHTGPHR